MLHEIRSPEGSTRAVQVFPRRAIRLFCQECLGWDRKEVFHGDCGGGGQCNLFPFRNRSKSRGAGSPLKAIRRECRVCMGGNPQLIADCPDRHCCLWPYRFGKNPNLAEKAKFNVEGLFRPKHERSPGTRTLTPPGEKKSILGLEPPFHR